MKHTFLTLTTAVALVFLAAPSAFAATSTWSGASGADWGTASSWNAGAGPVPPAANTALFNTGTGTSIAVASASAESIASISFDTAAANFTIGTTGGGTLTLGASGAIQILSTLTATNAVETINAPIVIGSGIAAIAYNFANNSANGAGAGAGTLNFGGTITSGATAATTTLTLSGSNTNANTISGIISNGTGTNTVAVTKSGAGTWVLTGGATGNTYTGATTINQGTLTLDFANATPASNIISASGILTMGGGTLNLTGKASTTNSQTFASTTLAAGASSFTINNNATANPDSVTLGAITRNVGSTVNFNLPVNGTNGATNGYATGTGTASTILTSSGAAYATVGFDDWAAKDAGNAFIVGLSTLSGYTANTSTTLSGNADMSAGSTTLAAPSTITSLRFDAAAANTTVTATGQTLTTGGILVGSNVAANNTFITGGTLEGASGKDLTIIQNSAGTLTISSVIADNTTATGLTTSGAGTTLLTGLNTYTGATTIGGGTLTIGGSGDLGNSGGSGSYAGTIKDNGTLNYNSSANQILSSIFSGTGAVIQNGAGTLTLSGNSSAFAGSVTLNSGTLNINNAGALGGNGIAGVFTISGGTIDNTLGSAVTLGVLGVPESTSSGLVVINGNFTFTGSNNLSFASGQGFSLGTATGTSRTITLTAGTLSFNGGAIANGTTATQLIEGGNGTLVLSGASTFTGGFTLNGGTVDINVAGGAGTNGPLGNGGTFTINGGTIDNTSAAAKVVANVNPITLGGSGFAYSTSAGTNLNNLTLPGAVSMGADQTITLNGAGVLTLSGALTNTANSARTLTVNNGATTTTFGSLSIGSYNLTEASGGSAVTDIINGTSNITISGVVADGSGTGSGLTYSGTGALTLNGTNTFTGGINLNSGTLNLGNNAALGTGTLTIAAGATLAVVTATRTTTNNNTMTWNGNFNLITQGFTLNLGTGTDTLGADVNITVTGDHTPTFGGTVTGNHNFTVTTNNGLTAGVSISGNIDNGGTFTSAGTGGNTASGITVSGGIGSSVTDVVQNNPNDRLRMNGGTYSYTGNLIIKAGIAEADAVADVGTHTIVIGDSSGSANATFETGLSGTYTNTAVSIASGNSGIATISSEAGSGDIINAPVTLNSHDLVIAGGGLGHTTAGVYTVGNIILSGGITSTGTGGNLTLQSVLTTGTVTLSGASLINNAGTITNNGGGNGLVTISAPLGANVGLVTENTTTSTLLLSGNNSAWTNNLLVTAGTAQLGSTNALSASNTVTVNTGGTFDINANTVTIAGLNDVSGAGGTVTNSAAASAATLTLGGSGTYSYAGVITATTPANLALTVALTGGGTQTLTGAANTFSGAVAVNSGILGFTVGNVSATAAQSLGENAGLSLGVAATSSGTLQYSGTGAATLAKNISVLGNGSDTIQNSGSGLLTLSGTVTKANTTLTLNGGANGINVTNVISGGTPSDFNSDLNIVSGVTTISVAATYYGPTNVYKAGTLKDGVTNALPTGTVLTLGNSGDGAVTNTFDLNGFNQTVAAINSVSAGGNSNIITNGAAGTGTNTLTLTGVNSDSNPASSSFGGVIQDGATAFTALTVSGGTHTLTGPNTYSGATLISGGTLQVGSGSTGSIGGTTSVTINTGGTLLFGSTTNNAVNTAATATLAGGTMAFAVSNTKETMGALTLTANSVIDFGAGQTNDTLIFAGTDITGLASNTISVYDYTLGGDHLAFSNASFSLSSTELADISFYSGGVGSTFLGTGNQIAFTVSPANYEVVPGVAVPEPSTLFGGLCLLGFLGWSNRRRIQERGRTLVCSLS